MKKLTALILALGMILMSASAALADTAYARLKQRIATRTGPGTEYSEPGTFLGQGDYVTVHSRVWDHENEIWWVQVEFSDGGERYRAYTGSWRMNVDLSRVPVEQPLGLCWLTADADVFAGPGWDYVMWNQTVYRGTCATLLAVEDGYGHIEYWDARVQQMWRVWAPLSCLDCDDAYYDNDMQYDQSGTHPYRPGGGSYGSSYGSTYGGGRSGQTCRITANSGNARSGAGTEYRTVDRVRCGEWYTILDTARASNGVLWYQINVGGQYGWISSGLTNFGLE